MNIIVFGGSGFLGSHVADVATENGHDVTIFDLQGRKVANLYSGILEQQRGHKFTWDASNVASGQYFVRITAPGYSDVHNMTLLK